MLLPNIRDLFHFAHDLFINHRELKNEDWSSDERISVSQLSSGYSNHITVRYGSGTATFIENVDRTEESDAISKSSNCIPLGPTMQIYDIPKEKSPSPSIKIYEGHFLPANISNSQVADIPLSSINQTCLPIEFPYR